MMIVIGQAAHVYVCRTSTTSIFEHGIFDNRTTNIGAALGITLGCLVVSVPFLQSIDGASNPRLWPLIIGALIALTTLWGGTELRKWFSRNHPHNWFNKLVQW
jgi:hypothetical protein